MMVIENKFEIGQIVYLVTDSDQKKRIVTGIVVKPGSVAYMLQAGTYDTTHYEFELSDTVDTIITTTN